MKAGSGVERCCHSALSPWQFGRWWSAVASEPAFYYCCAVEPRNSAFLQQNLALPLLYSNNNNEASTMYVFTRGCARECEITLIAENLDALSLRVSKTIRCHRTFFLVLCYVMLPQMLLLPLQKTGWGICLSFTPNPKDYADTMDM